MKSSYSTVSLSHSTFLSETCGDGNLDRDFERESDLERDLEPKGDLERDLEGDGDGDTGDRARDLLLRVGVLAGEPILGIL